MTNMKNKVGTRLVTNMQMTVKITDDFTIEVSHKDGLCDLNTVFEYGNKLRVAAGKPEKDMDIWLRSNDTLEFLVAHEKLTYSNFNTGMMPELGRKGTNGFKGLNCYKATKGRYSKTRADLLLTIKAAV